MNHNFGQCHLSVFYLKHDISENGFCLSLQVEPTEMFPETETRAFCWAHFSWFHLKRETESSFRNVVFLNKRQDDR
jgi:hypothetical protein